MSITEDELAQDRMDDDGYGCAITGTPEPALTAAGYLAALGRFERIAGSITEIKREARAAVDRADDEWAAASADLARFEMFPGVPLPQFRQAHITRPPEDTRPPAWTLTIKLTGVRDASADDALNRVSARLAGTGARTIYARADRSTP